MSGRFRWSIRRKLFALIVVILAVHVVVLVFMGSTLFERFYMHNKVAELKNSAKQIKASYAQLNSTENLEEIVDQLENRNSVLYIFSLGDTGAPELQYYTRGHDRSREDDARKKEWEGKNKEEDQEPGQESEAPADSETLPDPSGREPKKMFSILLRYPEPPTPILDENLLARLPTLANEPLIDEGFGEGLGGRIRLLARLDDNLYLSIETPKDYIRSTAVLAVQYTSVLSVAILLAGSAAIYFLTGRITRPIRSMQNVADKIAGMDFSESCAVHSRDELGALSDSINHMAVELQSNIDKLIAANEVLQNDLLRQQQTDRMRRQFVANVSHDFKTPLTLVISYAEALSDMPDAAARAEYCATIIDEGNKLARMVGSLLRLSQLESGTQKLEPSLFCLGEVLDAVIGAHRILVEKRGLRAARKVAGDLVVRADYQKIEQVFTNLYENAVKYAEQGGRIEVSVSDCGPGKCEISVYNEGGPIPEEVMESLFDSFYRADPSRHRDSHSYGLGLAIVKAIVEMHGERCGVENISGGVRFWFTLPTVELGGESADEGE